MNKNLVLAVLFLQFCCFSSKTEDEDYNPKKSHKKRKSESTDAKPKKTKGTEKGGLANFGDGSKACAPKPNVSVELFVGEQNCVDSMNLNLNSESSGSLLKLRNSEGKVLSLVYDESRDTLNVAGTEEENDHKSAPPEAESISEFAPKVQSESEPSQKAESKTKLVQKAESKSEPAPEVDEGVKKKKSRLERSLEIDMVPDSFSPSGRRRRTKPEPTVIL